MSGKYLEELTIGDTIKHRAHISGKVHPWTIISVRLIVQLKLLQKIRLNLGLVNLLDQFENQIYSSYDIGSWKPDPGIFLYAAKRMGFEPEECAVIEDSASGIRAAIAGGFKVYALANEKKKKTFEQEGAIAFENMKELEKLLAL